MANALGFVCYIHSQNVLAAGFGRLLPTSWSLADIDCGCCRNVWSVASRRQLSGWGLCGAHIWSRAGFGFLGTPVPQEIYRIDSTGNQAMADRFTYIPMIGLLVIISWGVF